MEIDNNGAENAIRPTAVGKKNWLFIGGEDTGWRSAVIYTLIGNALRHGHDPQAYLKDLFTRLPNTANRDRHQFLPSQWSVSNEKISPPVS